MNSIIQNVGIGLAQTMILFSIHLLGYIVPNNRMEVVNQPAALLQFFNFSMAGVDMLTSFISFILIFILFKDNHEKESVNA